MSESADAKTWLLQRLAQAAEPARPLAALQPSDRLGDDLAIDSLAFIELMVDFEGQFDVRLDESELVSGAYLTVDDVLTRLAPAGPTCP